MAPMPGGEMASRPLHFIWIVDCSGSMGADGKIQALNTAIDESLPGMRQVAAENPNADVLIRAIAFSHGAQWHVSQLSLIHISEPTRLLSISYAVFCLKKKK